MNTLLKHMIETQQPKVTGLDQKEQNRYKAGLLLLATFIREDFLDIPILPENKHANDGLFYSIPFLHDDVLYQNGFSQTLLVVYSIQDRSSSCPLRFEFEMVDRDSGSYKIHVHDQTGNRSSKHLYVERDNGEHYTGNTGIFDLTLSELIAHFA